MNIPDTSNKIWQDLLLGDNPYEFEFLALKFLLGRLKIKVRYDPSAQSVQDSAMELRELFVKFYNLPKLQADLQKIINTPEKKAESPKVAPKAEEQMIKVLHDPDQVKRMIAEGRKLILAGDESVISKLPEGQWIGGTIPYFITQEGGLMTREKIHVTELPSYVKKVILKSYNAETVTSVYSDIPENGFSVIIIPASSNAHLTFALKAPSHKDFAARPLIGWIAGVHIDEIGKKTAKIIFGEKARIMEDGAVAMHVALPQGYFADLNIINIFKQGSGDILTFMEDSFSVRDALINGKKRNLAEYIAEKNLDTKLPLVANYSGAMINVSFQNIDKTNRLVSFYAPVFKGVEYRHAAPVADYINEFMSSVPREGTRNIFFSCNCILNYLYSELEGKRTGNITGPTTFGEIAYQLLNQTLAYLTINKM